MDKATEKYINYCRLYLGDDIATTDEKIDEAIKKSPIACAIIPVKQIILSP
jgi:hypothetical protein